MSDRIRIESFKAEHFQAMDLKGGPGQEVLAARPDRLNLLEGASKHPSWTLICDAHPVACFGAVILWPGVAEAWAFVAKDISSCKVSFVRNVWIKLKEVEIRHNLHRVQAVAHEKYREGNLFLIHLGFEPEARLRGYGADKSNYIMYARRAA